jgi:hypothetical protein
VRLTCDKLNVNAELLGNKSADIVDGKAFPKGGGCLSGVELPMFMIKPPDSIRARNSVQINAPGSVTLI